MTEFDPAREPSHELVKAAYARDQVEAEFYQGLLRDAGVHSLVRRAPGFDVPEFLAGGPREILVAADNLQTAREVLLLDDPFREAPTHDSPRRVLAGLLIGAALVALIICLTVEVLP